jgi:hypothetical protein
MDLRDLCQSCYLNSSFKSPRLRFKTLPACLKVIKSLSMSSHKTRSSRFAPSLNMILLYIICILTKRKQSNKRTNGSSNTPVKNPPRFERYLVLNTNPSIWHTNLRVFSFQSSSSISTKRQAFDALSNQPTSTMLNTFVYSSPSTSEKLERGSLCSTKGHVLGIEQQLTCLERRIQGRK